MACGIEDPAKDGGIVDGEGRGGVDYTVNHPAPSHLKHRAACAGSMRGDIAEIRNWNRAVEGPVGLIGGGTE